MRKYLLTLLSLILVSCSSAEPLSDDVSVETPEVVAEEVSTTSTSTTTTVPVEEPYALDEFGLELVEPPTEIEEQIGELMKFADLIGIKLFASTWDKDSVDVMSKYTKIGKLGSASINDLELCKYAREKFDFLIISTGMSTEEEIEKCVEVCNPDVIMHTNSTYPCPEEDLNLRYIEWLKNKYPTKEIGYSGHEYRLSTTTVAVGLGATWVERHITLDRNMWGSDQKSSIQPAGLFHLMDQIKVCEKAIQYPPQERLQFEGENSKRESLRKKL